MKDHTRRKLVSLYLLNQKKVSLVRNYLSKQENSDLEKIMITLCNQNTAIQRKLLGK